MSYFLGIEVSQTNDGIFITQKKYAKPMLTPIEEKLKLVKDGGGKFVNATNFNKLVGSLKDTQR